MRIKPRNDWVTCRAVKATPKIGGLAMPESSVEGWDHIIEAVGPLVEGLRAGDKVMVKGQLGVDYQFIPNNGKLFAIQEKNVVLVFEQEVH